MIGGTQRENKEFDLTKYVGVFTGKVVAINPSKEEYETILDKSLPEDSRATEYLGETSEGEAYVMVAVWLQDDEGKNFKIPFFLKNIERENKDMTKKQYINNIGMCTWADDPNNLPDWFIGRDFTRDYRVAMLGEEELYAFLRVWLSNLNFSEKKTTLVLDWKKVMKGDVRELREQIDGEFSTNVGALATVSVKQVGEDIREYQGVYNKAFFPGYALKYFKLVDYGDEFVQDGLQNKPSRDRKPHERFVLSAISDYGCKDFYKFEGLRKYKEGENLAASSEAISEEGDDY